MSLFPNSITQTMLDNINGEMFDNINGEILTYQHVLFLDHFL